MQKSPIDEEKTTSKEFEDFGTSAKLGSDFSLFAIMTALILFCLSAWLGYGHLSNILNRQSVTPSIPNSVVIYERDKQ